MAVQHVDGGLTRVRVLLEGLPGGEGNERLAQDVLMTAVHGVGAAAIAGALGDQQVFADQRCEGHLVHGRVFLFGC